ncbi:MAG: tetratricopeptide repeat protein [Sphingomonadaceae bacterium]|nr:tetratricopeptide repeat protein [Sphingomonadaceae bacterium]
MASTPPTNEAFLREVDEELRRDRMVGVWKRWGRWIVAGVIAALALLAGGIWWNNHRDAQAGVEGEQLATALEDLSSGKQAGLEPKFRALAASKSDGTRAAAALTLADMAMVKGDLRGAARQFGAIAADASLDKPYRDLALIRQTAAEYDTLPPAQVVARLKPLAMPGNPWFGTAGELTGIAYMRMNQPQLAAALFKALAADPGVPETIRSRVVQLAGILGVDAIPQRARAIR